MIIEVIGQPGPSPIISPILPLPVVPHHSYRNFIVLYCTRRMNTMGAYIVSTISAPGGGGRKKLSLFLCAHPVFCRLLPSHPKLSLLYDIIIYMREILCPKSSSFSLFTISSSALPLKSLFSIGDTHSVTTLRLNVISGILCTHNPQTVNKRK